MKSLNIIRVLQEMWKHIRRYKGAFFFGLVAIAVAEILGLFVPIFYKKFFDLLTGAIVVPKPELLNALVGVIFLVLVIHSISWLLWRTIAFVHNWFIPHLQEDFIHTAHESLHKHSYGFFLDNFVGSLVRKAGRVGQSCSDMTETIQFIFLPLIIVVTGELIILYTRHPTLALILLVWIVVFVTLNVWFSLWKYKYDLIQAEIDSEVSGLLSDSVSNATTVKLFTGIAHERSLFHEATNRLRKIRMFRWNIAEGIDALQYGLMILIEFVLMYFAISYWQQGLLTIGDFALIQGIFGGLFDKLSNIGKVIRRFYESFSEASEMVEIIQKSTDVTDGHNAKTLSVTLGQVDFKDVTFAFRKTRLILKKLNLSIKPGEKVAFVGPSGAGKSTITKLLLRFYDVSRGKIFIDGQIIAKVTQESLRAQIAMVPQEPLLFHRSIMDNIRYGRLNATDEEVYEASMKARCHDFISQLQDGYKTFVGERGVKLSGGERQRVAIARALLKNAPILILDEATSSLDSESESLIQEALKELMKGKTTIVIAHRLSTIMHMDRIIVIENGQVVDTGTHKDLLKRRAGTYNKLWSIQTSEYVN